jgi:hypothetical protein
LTSLIRQKKLLRFISFVLIFLFTFTSISVPYAEARDAIPEQRVINDIPPLSDTVNQPRFNNANVIIAPPSDLPIKPGKERVEIPSRRSANTKIFLEPDGTFTKEIYSQSIFYQNDKISVTRRTGLLKRHQEYFSTWLKITAITPIR